MLRLGIMIAIAAPLVACGPSSADDRTPEERLAVQFARGAARVIDADVLTVPAIEAAWDMIREAVSLDPDNAELWRFAAELAVVADREEGLEEAITRLVQLDSRDTRARLMRLSLALDRYDTAEERIEAYRRLLAPEQREKLDPAVASHLSLDLALLLRRHGDLDGFADALTDAVAFDPSNRGAAAIAAGFFRMTMDDPYGEAELLTNLLLADPSDITTQIALAKLLLEHGAYGGAEQLYELATANQFVLRIMSTSGLLADQAIAQWANGHPDAALGTIRKRQKQMDEVHEAQLQSEEPELDPRARAERARERALISPVLATVRAAIQRERGDQEASESVSRALQVYAEVVQGARADPDATEAEIAQLELGMAWVAAWLGGDGQTLSSLLEAAEQYQPLSEAARARFEGWQALGRGDPAAAVQLLAGPAGTDPAASLGLAEAYLQMGLRKDAGRVFLDLARAQPGSLSGVWASNRLARLVGRRVPISELAGRLEGLIASIPPSFFRYPETPSLALGLSVEPAKTTFQAFEPVIVNIVVTNNSPHYPLAIDRDGPIRPEVVLEYSTTTSAASMQGIPPSVVVDLDRRLRLEPLERLVIPVDLRRLAFGSALDDQVLHGTIVLVKATLNATITSQGAVQPMLLGSGRWSPTFRIEGVPMNVTWIREAMDSAREPESPDHLLAMGLLAQIVGPPATREQYEAHHRLPAMQVELLVRAGDLFSSAFAALDGASQAWLLSVTPPGRILPSVREMAQASDDRLLRLAYLLFHVSGPNDPAVQAALQSSDDHFRRVAERFVELFEQMTQGGQGQLPPAVPGQRTQPR
jgi:tetratricopeptide (TPR) repeat protein